MINNELFKLFSLVTGPKAYVPPTPPQEFNEATGGTITEYTNSADGRKYRRHTFTGSSTLAVTKAVDTFRAAVFAGGGGGGGAADDFWSDGGGQGGYYDTDISLAVGSHVITVGDAGGGGQGQLNGGVTDGGYGGDTSIAGVITAGGGGKGGGGYPPADHAGRRGTPSPAADGYSGGVGNPLAATYGLPSTTGNGGAGNRYGQNGYAGVAGAAVIEYEIAAGPPPPTYNDATGGTITEFVDSTSGLKYRVHTFTAADTFEVTASVAPFQYLVCGGGSGGGGSNNAAHGSGGGGGQASEQQDLLAVGSYPVVVGSGGGGGAPNGANGGTGGTSSFNGVSKSAGPGGCSACGGSVAGSGGANLTSTITGTATLYGQDAPDFNSGATASGPGGGGRGASVGTNGGSAGQTGRVIVRYQIAA